MKKILIAFLLLSLFAGCKKNDIVSFQSYIRFKLDGVQTECTQHISGGYASGIIPDNTITISGNWPGGSISLRIYNVLGLSPGLYAFEPSTLRYGEIWTTGTSSSYHSGQGGGTFNPSIYGSGQVTFTEINAEYVKGSFEFVTGLHRASNTFKTVTNGISILKEDKTFFNCIIYPNINLNYLIIKLTKMSKLLPSILLLLVLSANLFGQQTTIQQKNNHEYYLKKSKNQNTAAWILATGGTLTALISMTSFNFENTFGSILDPGSGSEENINRGATSFSLGCIAALGSIPLFIASAKNKKKANNMSAFFKIENRSLFQQGTIVKAPYPALSLKLRL